MLLSAAGAALIAGAVPTYATAPGVSAATVNPDPAVGPHARDDSLHRADHLSLTPNTTAIIPRRVARSGGAAPAGAAAGPTTTAATGTRSPLRREVLGFAPYWELSQNGNWNYSLLSTVAYFGLDVQGDGSFNQTTQGWTGWNSSQLATVINNAHAAGDRVLLVIKQFDNPTICSIIYTPGALQNAINNTIAAIKSKSLDGVNVDFEGSNGTCSNGQTEQGGFTNFMSQLSSQVHTALPGAVVSVDTYSGSASWDGGIFKIGDLAPVVDSIFVMAYDMNFSNMPAHAGPNAPLNGLTYNDTLAVQQYLSKAPASKIILGVPYYGYKYCTVDSTPYSAETANGVCPDPGQTSKTSAAESDTYSGVLSDFACAQNLTKSWDSQSSTPWANWPSPATNDPCGGNHGSWRELYYDNADSLGLKYDLVNTAGLQGTGMWALGYDGSSPDLWQEVAAKFSGPPTTFYFAEGYTGYGFNETISLLMPTFTGTAYIDYYTENGHLPTFGIKLTAGQVATVNVNQYVGAGHNVSAVVTLPASGVAERVMHFNNGRWHGSTANVGAAKPSGEWDFAEGSTLSLFSEYLTLENPSGTAAPVTLNYFTSKGDHPVKSLTLAPNSRTTVQVYSGDLSSPAAACTPGGNGANCGVGPGIDGVSVQVLSPTVPVVAERPMYVNNASLGNGLIKDGHDAFGVNAAAPSWDFAEGTTINGFKEYLTLQNPGGTLANVTLKFVDTSGTVTNRTVSVGPQSRSTVPVFDPVSGVGPGVSGVSTHVSSDQPIVAERPMYMVFNFGSGVVAGAHDVTGVTATGTLFEFSNASTVAGENDYLTIENLNSTTANLTISYYGPGGRGVRTASVGPNSRHTIAVSVAGEGAGPNLPYLGIAVASDQPVLVEEPTYNATSAGYGATDTVGYAPPS